MKLVWQGNHDGLAAAAAFVTGLSENESFWADIAAIRSFDHSRLSGREVAQLLRAHADPVDVRLYRKKWPWGAWMHRHTNAYVDESEPTTIFYHEKKLWRPVDDMVDTLAHEFVHVVDYADLESPRIDYGHHGNDSQGNENTAPYVIGSLARAYYSRR